MISRIAYLRAERANIARLIQECREVVPPAIGSDGAIYDPGVMLTQRMASLDCDISEWETAAKRVL